MLAAFLGSGGGEGEEGEGGVRRRERKEDGVAGADYLFPQSYLEFHPHLFLVLFFFGGGGGWSWGEEVMVEGVRRSGSGFLTFAACMQTAKRSGAAVTYSNGSLLTTQ